MMRGIVSGMEEDLGRWPRKGCVAKRKLRDGRNCLGDDRGIGGVSSVNKQRSINVHDVAIIYQTEVRKHSVNDNDWEGNVQVRHGVQGYHIVAGAIDMKMLHNTRQAYVGVVSAA
jgi:hypothetical protein